MNSKIAIPKGRLFPYVDSLFRTKTGKTIDIGESRKLFIKDVFPNVDLFYAKAKSIPQLIYSGQVDFGFCGDDIISDSFYKNDIFEVGDTHLDKISLCVCSRLSKDELFSMKRPIIVATEYENLANQYFTGIGIPHYILNTYGSTEGYIDLGAGCIIDVVETGETLRQNNINIIRHIRREINMDI